MICRISSFIFVSQVSRKMRQAAIRSMALAA
jgi:hypothetical protein